MTRVIYFIREKNTNSWCTTSRHADFSEDIDNAIVFLQKENAEKAIKKMLPYL